MEPNDNLSRRDPNSSTSGFIANRKRISNSRCVALAIPNGLCSFYFWSILAICLFACSKASFTLSSSTTTSSWMVSSLIFFASLRASFMSSEICFSFGGSVLLRSFTVTYPDIFSNIPSYYPSVNTISCRVDRIG